MWSNYRCFWRPRNNLQSWRRSNPSPWSHQRCYFWMLQHGWNKCIKRDHWLPSWPERSCWRCCFEFFRPWKRDASWRNLLESAVFTKNTTFSCLLQVHSQRSTLFQIEVQKHQPGRSNQNNKRDGCIHAITCDTFGGSSPEASGLLHLKGLSSKITLKCSVFHIYLPGYLLLFSKETFFVW